MVTGMGTLYHFNIGLGQSSNHPLCLPYGVAPPKRAVKVTIFPKISSTLKPNENVNCMRERASCQNHDDHNNRQFMVVLRPIRLLHSAKICHKCTSGRHKLQNAKFPKI